MKAARTTAIISLADKMEPRMRNSFYRAVNEMKSEINMTALAQSIANNDRVLRFGTALGSYSSEVVGDRHWNRLLGSSAKIPTATFGMAGDIGAKGLNTQFNISSSFAMKNPRAQAWARANSSRLITQIGEDTRKGIQQVIGSAYDLGLAPRKTAQVIRGMVGLTERQTQAVFKFSNKLIKEGRKTDQVLRMTNRYHDKLLRYRANNIARTEIANAANEGLIESWRQASDQGLLDPKNTNVEWLAAFDDRICPVCAELGGTIYSYEDIEKGVAFAPPAHPMCRCTLGITFDKVTGKQPAKQPSDFEGIQQPTQSVPEIASSTADGVQGYPVANTLGKDTLQRFRRPDGTWTTERAVLHRRIMDDILEGYTSQDTPTVLFSGGGPASGKSTVDQFKFSKNMVTINPDDIKALLPEWNFLTGTNKAAFVHEESSYLAKEIIKKAYAKRFNVFIDGTGDSSYASIAKKVAQARANGSRVVAHYVTVETDVAVARMIARGKRTGRYVPEPYMRDVHASVSRIVPEAFNKGLFDELTLWDTSTRTPIKVAKGVGGVGRKPAWTILDDTTWNRFIAKGLRKIPAEPRTLTPWPISDDVARFKGTEYPDVIKDKYGKWVDDISASEFENLKDYTESGYARVNQLLRKQDPPTSQTQEKVSDIKNALKEAGKINTPPPPELVWRGISSEGYKDPDKWRDLLKKKPGDVVKLEGFQSTSIDPYKAIKFGEGEVVLEIMPNSGAYLAGLSSHEHELEFLLDEGLKYLVRGIKPVQIGQGFSAIRQTVIQLEMLP